MEFQQQLDAFVINTWPGIARQIEGRMARSRIPGTFHSIVRGQWKLEGKRIRAFLAFKTGTLLEVPEKDVALLSAATEMIHLSSLIHDDIIDRDTRRRGKPSLWKESGIPKAVIAGDLLFTFAFQVINWVDIKTRAPGMLLFMTDCIQDLISGQYRDITHTQNDDINDWAQTAAEKTGSLLHLSIYLPFVYKGLQDEGLYSSSEKVKTILGVLFQGLDDINDFKGKKEGRRAGDDVKNGRNSIMRYFPRTRQQDPLTAAGEYLLRQKRDLDPLLSRLDPAVAGVIDELVSLLIKKTEVTIR